MPIKSKTHRRLFVMALAVKRGEVVRSKVSKVVLRLADTTSEKKLGVYTSTDHEELPRQTKGEMEQLVNKIENLDL
jgi:hypothetical protein